MIMKKINLFSSAFVAALMLASCSAEDAINGGNTENSSTGYLAVNIVDVNGAGTRAADESYVPGTADENAVNSARFYFFKSDGSAFYLSDGTNSASPTDGLKNTKKQQNGNIESEVEAVVIINGSETNMPAGVVAVVNPTDELAKTYASVSALKAATLKATYTTADSKKTNFIMSNSVYKNTDNTEFCATPISSSNISFVSADDAKYKAVDIYVERVAAKVLAKTSGESWTEATTNISGFPTKGMKIKLDQKTTTSKEVYAVVLGWGLTEDLPLSYAVKNIDTNWTDDNLGWDVTSYASWTNPSNHRSYWATSVPTSVEGNTNNHPAFNAITNAISSEYSSVYTTENTGDTKTKLIVAAQLQYSDGTVAEICKYDNQQYLSVDDTKSAILTAMKNKGWKVTTASVTSGDLAANEVEFKTLSSTEGKDYEVALQLTDAAKTSISKVTKDGVDSSVDALNGALKAEKAQVRKSGYVYYYTSIQHFGKQEDDATARYGVVRNHAYQLLIDGIKGFGTPVYDPERPIIPDTPDEKEIYLAAKMYVLQWRLVPEKHITLGE